MSETGSTAAVTGLTLTETGTLSTTSTKTGNSIVGTYSTSQTGSDSFALTETGTASGGSFTEGVTGNETNSLSESGNSVNQTFTRSDTGSGSYSLTDSGAGATLNNGSGNYGYGLSEGGNWRAGAVSQSETGSDRYSLLEAFNNVADTANGTPGHLDFSPFGNPFADPPPKTREQLIGQLKDQIASYEKARQRNLLETAWYNGQPEAPMGKEERVLRQQLAVASNPNLWTTNSAGQTVPKIQLADGLPPQLVDLRQKLQVEQAQLVKEGKGDNARSREITNLLCNIKAYARPEANGRDPVWWQMMALAARGADENAAEERRQRYLQQVKSDPELKKAHDQAIMDFMRQQRWAFKRQLEKLSPEEQEQARRAAPWLFGSWKSFTPQVQVAEDGTVTLGYEATPELKQRQLEQALNLSISGTRLVVRKPGTLVLPTAETAIFWYQKYGWTDPAKLLNLGEDSDGIHSDDTPLTVLASAGAAGLLRLGLNASLFQALDAAVTDVAYNLALNALAEAVSAQLGATPGALTPWGVAIASALVRKTLPRLRKPSPATAAKAEVAAAKTEASAARSSSPMPPAKPRASEPTPSAPAPSKNTPTPKPAGGKGSKPNANSKQSLPSKNSCFPAGTLVATLSGHRPIEQIRDGELVRSFDFETGEWVVGRVEVAEASEYTGAFLTLQLEGGERLEVTADHPIWVVEGNDLDSRPELKEGSAWDDSGLSLAGRWVFSQDLRVGDRLFTANGSIPVVLGVVRHWKTEQVFNLALVGRPFYAVAGLGLLVHNSQTAPSKEKVVQWSLPLTKAVNEATEAARKAAKAAGKEFTGLTQDQRNSVVRSAKQFLETGKGSDAAVEKAIQHLVKKGGVEEQVAREAIRAARQGKPPAALGAVKKRSTSGKHSRILGQNMEKAVANGDYPDLPGLTKPTSGGTPQASHLVPSGDYSNHPRLSQDAKDAIKLAQDVYEKSGMNINDPRNGFWASSGQLGTANEAYFIALRDAMQAAKDAGGDANAVAAALKDLRMLVLGDPKHLDPKMRVPQFANAQKRK